MEIKIYKINCECCDKYYIGSTKQKNILERLYGHNSDYKIKSSKFYQHFKEVGQDKFKITILKELTVKDFKEQRIEEQKVIEEYDSIVKGFNTRNSFQSDELKRECKRKINKKYSSKPENKIKHNIYRLEYRAKLREEQKYKCIACNYSTGRIDTYKRHCNSKRHISKSEAHTQRA